MSKTKLTSLSWLGKPLILIIVIVLGMGTFKGAEHSFKESLASFKILSQVPQKEETTESSQVMLETVTLKRVVDGDTIVVLKSNQEEIRVRMIGVDTPESVHPDETKNTTEGDVASAYTKSQLKQGQTLYLEYDEEPLDRYGRTLAYVWLQKDIDSTDLNDIQTKMYNAKLIIDGYAVAKRFPPNTKYATIFESLK